MTRWASALALILFASAADAAELPDFGSPADAALSKSREAQIGRGVMLQLRNAGVMVDDPFLTEYVSSLGSQLATHVNDSGGFNFNFFVVRDDRINAFALPGGYIGINSGLILASENESELAGVLAHEISHVTQRHIARSVYDSQRTSIISMATMLAALVLGAATDMPSDAMQGIVTGSQALAAQRQINFTRSNEHEADRVGIELLANSGFDPSGMSGFFEKLGRRYGSSGFVPELLLTHPVTSDRVAEARDRARQLPRVTHTSSQTYALTKARIVAMTAATPEAALAAFRNANDESPATDRYGLALASMRMSLHDNAERLFRALITEFPGVMAFRVGQAEAMAASGATDAALALYADSIRLFPRNVPLTISYAETLLAAGEAKRAHALLLDLLNNVPPTPAQLRLIARAANAEGDVANSYFYMSYYYAAIGNLPLAIGQVRLALETPDANGVDRARFRSRLDQLIEYLPDDQRHLATTTGP